MRPPPIRVGFIGLNPSRGWAAGAHLPALRSLESDYEIVGVANRNLESARHTAGELNLPRAFATPEDLVASPEIDLVAITVKVPHHFALASAALGAGKHVYCEWPLGNGLEEARRLASLASERRVVAVVGTQARTAAGVDKVRSLVGGGYVGRVLSCSVIASGGNWGEQTTADSYYFFDGANGATMQSIAVGHTLAAIQHVLGGFDGLDATFVRNLDTVLVIDTGEVLPKSVPDQVMVQGRTRSGAAISVHFRAGVSRATNFLWEINGTEGDIRVTGDLGYPQMVELSIAGARHGDRALSQLDPDPGGDAERRLSPAARSVAGIYELAARDIRTGSRDAPTFHDGVALHELVARIEASAASKGQTDPGGHHR